MQKYLQDLFKFATLVKEGVVIPPAASKVSSLITSFILSNPELSQKIIFWGILALVTFYYCYRNTNGGNGGNGGFMMANTVS